MTSKFSGLTKCRQAIAIATSVTIVIAIGFYSVDKAQACRDCPFPTPLAKLHWLMPSGNSEITVEEIELGHGRIQSVVRLWDAFTHDLLAIGRLDHQKGRKRIRVDIFDSAGGRTQADLYYTNQSRDKVQIRLTCEKCNVDAFYLN